MKKYPLLWQPAVLLLLVLLALIAAYRVRPSVPIKLGDYEDSIYLHDFHAREVDSAGSGREQAWPASATSLELPGERQGYGLPQCLRQIPNQTTCCGGLPCLPMGNA